MVIASDSWFSCRQTENSKKSKQEKQEGTIHSCVVLGGATQVTLGAALAYDLHFKINFVLKLGVQGFLLLQAIGAIVCVLIYQLHHVFPLPSSVCKGGFK